MNSFENVKRPEAKKEESKTYNLILDVELDLSAVLGETDITLKQALGLTKGSIIELDNKTIDPIKLLANGKEIARGEVVIIEDNFGIKVTQTKDNTKLF
ncbi:MAG: FliM/FliN family flagellar motor switch protein [Candidatus Gastranaerophilales bacterium]|nr:FliM/FliN family flagellar motor switch protein [Candidatus Gastranaerophilales bacterium]